MAQADCNTSTIVAGAYKGEIINETEGSYPLGATDDGGFEIEINYAVEDIFTDQAGDTAIGSLYRGGSCFVNATFKAFDIAGVQRLLFMYADKEGEIGHIGCDVRIHSFDLLLTPVQVFINQPTEYKFFNVQLDPAVPLRWSLSSRLRVLPVRFRCYPQIGPDNLSPSRWYTVTPENPEPPPP